MTEEFIILINVHLGSHMELVTVTLACGVYSTGSQSVVPRPAASALPGNWLEMQCVASETLGQDMACCVLTPSPGCAGVCRSLRKLPLFQRKSTTALLQYQKLEPSKCSAISKLWYVHTVKHYEVIKVVVVIFIYWYVNLFMM